MNPARGRTVRSEWTKLRTVPSTGWLLVAATLSLVIVGALATASVDTSLCPTPAECYEDTAKLSLTGVQAAQAVVVVLATLAMTNEYATRQVHTTLAATPRREVILLAKASVVGAAVLVVSTVGVLGSLLAGRMILPGNGFDQANGYPPVSLADVPTLRAAVGTVLYLVLMALMSLGVATAVRDTAVALISMFSLIYVVPVLAELLVDANWQERLQRYGPTDAGLAIQATTRLDELPIGPWAGLGVLAAYAAGALLLGALFLTHRDA